MKLKIEDIPVKAPSISNTYELEISFAHDDANYIETKRVRVSQEHEDELIKLLQVVENCFLLCQTRGWGIEEQEYEQIEGYKDYFGHEPEISQEELNRLSKILVQKEHYYDSLLHHPQDEGNQIPAAFYLYELFYYNQNGVKFPVTIENKE